MKYNENEVLDILKLVSDNPEKILTQWNNNKANTPVEFGSNNHFVYSFPMIIKDEEVATITLVSLYGENNRDNLMQKYFGHEEHEKSWCEFSHDSYLYCYFTVNKEFKLPKIVKGLRGQTFIGKDVNNNDFEFKVSYGSPEKESDEHQYYIWIDKAYRFYNGVSIQVDKIKEGWSLGQKINENIKIRTRDQKIKNVIEKTI